MLCLEGRRAREKSTSPHTRPLHLVAAGLAMTGPECGGPVPPAAFPGGAQAEGRRRRDLRDTRRGLLCSKDPQPPRASPTQQNQTRL